MYKFLKCILLIITVSIAYGEIFHPIQIQIGTLTDAQITKATTTAEISLAGQQKMKIRLERAPIYAYPGMIVDFIIMPSVSRLQNDIENMFQYEFSDNKYLPPRIYISQGDRNEQIRVVFDYYNNIPYKPFVVTFKVKDQKHPDLGEASISIVLDSLSTGITSALRPDDKDDILR